MRCVPLALPFAAAAGAGALIGKQFGKDEEAMLIGAAGGLTAILLFHAYVLPVGGVSRSWQLFGCQGAASTSGMGQLGNPGQIHRIR